MRFDHVGIATTDAASLAALFTDLCATPLVHEERFNGLQVLFLKFDDGGYFELLEPDGNEPIGNYLDEHGPGIHHVALATDDIVAALERASDLGIELVDEEPRPGAWGHQVAFLHPQSTGGVLIEFVEH